MKLAFLLTMLLSASSAGARAAPVDVDGGWDGASVRKVKVGRRGGPKDEIPIAMTLAEGAWRSRVGEERFTGTYAATGRRFTLSYDDPSTIALEAELAERIEAHEASRGSTVDVTVTLTRVRTTARAKDSKRNGRKLRVKERVEFTVATTGDENALRPGLVKSKSVMRPGLGVPGRTVSELEVDPPYIADPDAFWARADLYVMRPDVEPLDLWPDEVLFPSAHGVKAIVLLPGDYRERSNGRLGPGILYIEDSGTAAEPILVTFAPFVGADLRDVPHAAERHRESEAHLVGFRIWNQSHQYIRGLTFSDGASACLLHTATDNVIDGCLWHETSPQPLRIRFDSHRNLVQRCVIRRFDRDAWGHGDTVAINLSDGALTHNRIVSNVILNYTDSYQHTDRDGEGYGLGAGTVIDNNVMGFTRDAYVDDPTGELMCGENTIDLKMGGTEAEPIVISNNVFFGVRAARAGCAATGSGGYAVTLHRRGTWVEFTGNVFTDVDSGVFLNTYFLNNDAGQGRIDPHLSLHGNTFTGIRSFATAFPARTGRVLSGLSPAAFTGNTLVDCERLMESEPFPGIGDLVIQDNTLHGPIDTTPRDAMQLLADGNVMHDGGETAPPLVEVVFDIPWSDLTLRYRAPR